jgi:16S rRNA processing protein RimM
VTDRICVARIGAAHGTRGEVRLWPFTEDPMAVAGYGPLETEDRSRRFELESVRPFKDHLIVRLRGVGTREAVEQLRNAQLFIPRDRLPAPEDDDTFYHADLIGLAAVRRDGSAFGTVLALHNFGAGDLLEIRPADGGPTVMLAFTRAAVPEVDLPARRIVVDPPQAIDGDAGPDGADAPARSAGGPRAEARRQQPEDD